MIHSCIYMTDDSFMCHNSLICVHVFIWDMTHSWCSLWCMYTPELLVVYMIGLMWQSYTYSRARRGVSDRPHAAVICVREGSHVDIPELLVVYMIGLMRQSFKILGLAKAYWIGLMRQTYIFERAVMHIFQSSWWCIR